MLKSNFLPGRLRWAAMVLLCGICPVLGADLKVLPDHVPKVISGLTPKGRLAATNQLRLAIGLPLRDPAGLDSFLAQVYDPASPNYRHYLTPEEFTARFGPTEAEYAAVKNFARTNGLSVTATFSNRLVLDVAGPASAVERALHITLRTYRLPSGTRDFFAPDAEPTVAASLPVTDIQGLSDFSRPHPLMLKQNTAGAAPKSGSGSGGAYFGDDFRNAYASNTTLTGAGQMVGLVQFDGFYASDIAAYAAAAGNGRAGIPVQTVLLDGYNGVPTTGSGSGNPEVSLDIEMAMAMAPGLAGIVVFEAGPSGTPNDVLNSMVSYSSTVKNLSCSWGWSGGPRTTTDNIFKNMAAQGQSFFDASGDSDAFTTGSTSVNGVDNTSLQNTPSSSPYITVVGGTTLTMNGTGGSYASETVWNWGGGSGSSGGISSYYSLPPWQTNITNLAGRGGSSSHRNIPDVAMTADNVFVYHGNGSSSVFGGTSCAAPLWAGFAALVNQQAAASGGTSVGFINPAIYSLSATANYASCFNDVTTGNNTWSSSPSLFYAMNGYDLCTGLGTPNGMNLINALAGVSDPLAISPAAGFAATGLVGGPFSGSTQFFTLTNSGGSALNWSLINTSSWINCSSGGGQLVVGQQITIAASLSAAASSLPAGNYSANVSFINQTTGIAQLRQFTLQVLPPLAVLPATGFNSTGPVGGPFSIASQDFVLTNLGSATLNWSLINTSSWLNASPASGTLTAGEQTTVTANLTSAASSLSAGTYTASLVFSNQNGWTISLPFSLHPGPLVQNGGFETGDFTGWTLSASSTYNIVSSSGSLVHSGSYGAAFGQYPSLGYLSQTLTTSPGQHYLISLWLDNPNNHYGATPNQFQVQWNGTTLLNWVNVPYIGWTNLQYVVTATGPSTVLQFGFEDTPYYLGLDDVSVTPLLPPEFKSAQNGTASFNLAWDAVSGLVYQVQYTTNLVQANWVNLGKPLIANTATLTISDTNAVSSAPQRFYRLVVSP
ncbi:MAG TPA: protease pro-enzyme activation domain-containing protein [Verrucomicrobiae bacterium]